MEKIITGYCRAQDQARTVMVEEEDGEWDISCDYPDCPYAGDCPIGKEIAEVQK